jgi:hypothetical protein
MWGFGTFVFDNFCASMVPNATDHLAFSDSNLGKCSMQHEM